MAEQNSSEYDKHSHEIHEEQMETRAQITWVIAAAFVLINVVSVFTALFTPFGAERLVKIAEIFFWFDFMCAGVIGAYFGVDILAKLKDKTNGWSR